MVGATVALVVVICYSIEVEDDVTGMLCPIYHL
jgi:hypothetical protein